MTIEDAYKEDVRDALLKVLKNGYRTLGEVCVRLEGPDPKLVQSLWDESLSSSSTTVSPDDAEREDARARKRAAELPLSLPAADPLHSQWWYTLDTIVDVSKLVFGFSGSKPVAFLGTPTVGFHYGLRYGRGVIFDSDPDVLNCLQLPTNSQGVQYDANVELPREWHGTFSVVVADPPWYPDETRVFLFRAREMLTTGYIVCTLPSRLTRPGLLEERTELIKELATLSFSIVGLKLNAVRYMVPGFEIEALRNVRSFAGLPWRNGDLLVLRISENTKQLPAPNEKTPEIVERFAQRAPDMRVFVRSDRANPTLAMWTERVPDFETNISTRYFDVNRIGAWSSNRKGLAIRDANCTRIALEAWAQRCGSDATVKRLTEAGIQQGDAKALATQLDQAFGLWPEEALVPRRTPETIDKYRRYALCSIVTEPSQREHEYESDHFRVEFQRDRDRILWSHGLKRLAHKTQVFSVESDGLVRQRLAHSVEVMQLASTIGISFGLDRDLIEAIAMAHDIGHAPFGHAGEHALNGILNKLNYRLGGFNHYEHGVDVVRWLEDIYQSPASDGFPGLNLTPEVCEGIFKHVYYRSNHEVSQTEYYKCTKHSKLFKDDFCHLEGQAVRIADKVSYLISDLEDGIRMGVFAVKDLESCRLFTRPPIDIAPSSSETLYDRFISQRRAILQVLMEDIILETERRLAVAKTLAGVRGASDYSVAHSREIEKDVTEVYQHLQEGILHKDLRVKAANTLATKIVSELFILFSMVPELVDAPFRRSYESLFDEYYVKHPIEKVGQEIAVHRSLVSPLSYEHMIGSQKRNDENFLVPTKNVLCARDYVASLTDARARRFHATLIVGRTLSA